MKRFSILLLVFFTCLALAAWSQAQPQGRNKIITFDVPGAGTGAGQGTFAWNIVEGDWISGNYIDGSGVYHGFLRAPDGTITTFDAPGMGTGSGQGVVEIMGLTPSLEIVGSYFDANNVWHAFLRTPRGKISAIDCPRAAASGGTAAGPMNAVGLISEMYLDVNGAWHGCIREPDGTFVYYDPPDAGTGSGQGTYVAPLNEGVSPDGTIVGEYWDNNWIWHGYIRAPDGNITEYDDPYAGSVADSGQGTETFGINPAGEIWGEYIDASFVFHGYLRSPDGSFTEIDVPHAGTGYIQGTGACWPIICFGGINPAGTVTGFLLDQNNVWHGFLRTDNGAVKEFDAPGAGTGAWQGTLPASITPDGTITGYYIDKNNVVHGFLRLPF
jgi:hypothetical protein